jgi:hypothetical protein
LPCSLSAQGPPLSIPTHLDAFQLQLTPFNSTPISSLVRNGPEALSAKKMTAAASERLLREAGASRDGAGRVISAPMNALTPGKRKIVEREAETRVGYVRKSRFGE